MGKRFPGGSADQITRPSLKGGNDLMTRRPYRNKRYAVACRKQGLKAIDGIFVETGTPIREVTCTMRWNIADEKVVTHHVLYRLLDQEFDTASDQMIMWSGTHGEPKDWESRRPEWAKNAIPCHAEPRMEVIPSAKSDWQIPTQDILSKERDWIISRHQTFAIPTIQRERFNRRPCSWTDRNPSFDSVFLCPGVKS